MTNALFSLFTNRLFLAVWIATLISNFGMQIHIMTTGWLMLNLAPSTQTVALVQVVASLPGTLFAVLAGTLSDIYDKRKIMLIALFITLLRTAWAFILNTLSDSKAEAFDASGSPRYVYMVIRDPWQTKALPKPLPPV